MKQFLLYKVKVLYIVDNSGKVKYCYQLNQYYENTTHIHAFSDRGKLVINTINL